MISVIITCYNYGHLLKEAVESVFRQTVSPGEIIVMDDCSNDNTQEIVSQWESIRYIRNDKNMQTAANIDRGVFHSSGKYLIHLDADNRMRPTYLEETSKILDENPKIGVVYTQCAAFGQLAAGLSSWSTWWRNKQMEGEFFIWEYFDFDRTLLRKRNYIHGSAMFRRKCYDEAGGYVANAVPGKPEDYTLWKKILLDNGWDAHYIKRPLLEYRQHSNEQRAVKGENK